MSRFPYLFSRVARTSFGLLPLALAATGCMAPTEPFEKPNQGPAELSDRVPTGAGPECDMGGFVTLRGFDDNRNGLLESEEVTERELACLEVADGDVIVTTAAELDELKDVSQIEGSLVIKVPGLTVASLPYLQQIDGSLIIQNTALEQLSLPSLESVGGDIFIGQNPRLSWIALGNEGGELAAQPFVRTQVGGDFTLFYNHSMTALELDFQQPAVGSANAYSEAELGQIVIDSNPRLTDLLVQAPFGFAAESLDVTRNDVLRTMRLDLHTNGRTYIAVNNTLGDIALTTQHFGSLVVDANKGLKSFSLGEARIDDGFILRNCPVERFDWRDASISGPVRISRTKIQRLVVPESNMGLDLAHNHELVSVLGAEVQSLQAIFNTKLEVLDVFGENMAGDIIIRGNPKLNRFPSLLEVEVVGGDVQFDRLNIENLSLQIFGIGGKLSVTRNPALASFRMPELRYAQDMVFYENPSLGLLEMPALQSATSLAIDSSHPVDVCTFAEIAASGQATFGYPLDLEAEVAACR